MTADPSAVLEDPISLCAAGEAAWQAAAYAGLEAPWRQDGDVAWAEEGAPHRYLLGAVTLLPRPRLPHPLVARAPGTLCDSWATLTTDDLPGWTPSWSDPWMAREPGPCAIPLVQGVVVERTDDALLFEDTAFRAAGGSPPARPGELHPGGSESVRGLHLFLARRDGVPIGTALSVVHDSGVVVSAVAVLQAERGRRIGSMLTAAATAVHPELPTTLSAGPLGLPVYRRLGFHELAAPVHWQPPA